MSESKLFYVDYTPDCIIYCYDYTTGLSEKVLNLNQELNENDFFTVSRLDVRKDDFLLVLDYDYRSVICNFRKGKVIQLEGISGIFLGDEAVCILQANSKLTVLSTNPELPHGIVELPQKII